MKDDVLVDMDVRMEIEIKNVSKLTQDLNLPPLHQVVGNPEKRTN